MQTKLKQRIVVGLSGGVDSAVTAHLLKQQGHEVVAIFMKNWEGDDDDAYCASNLDFVDAASVADRLGIEIEHVNFAAEYKDRVFAQFLREYSAGRTPNPDILCNAEIKFKAFLDYALSIGAEKIATGHYARVRLNPTSQHYELLKGLDSSKDQSYFLHRLTQNQLAKTLFPVGELQKSEVRRIADDIKLPNARKKDSTGICFIGERPFREFLNRYIASKPGVIEDENGRVIGRHIGLSFYTLGQRQGLGIGGLKPSPPSLATPPTAAALSGQGFTPPASLQATAHKASGPGASRSASTRGLQGSPPCEHQPWFVAAKDLARNVLVAVQGHGHPLLHSTHLLAHDVSWVAGAPPVAGRYSAKTRYRQADAACDYQCADSLTQQGFTLEFDSPQWAVTPGQSAVLYDGEVCLGGGIIESRRA